MDNEIPKLNKNYMKGIKLQNVLDKGFYDEIQKEISELKYKKVNQLIIYGSYSKAKLPKKLLDFLNSNEFLTFVSSALGRRIKRTDADAYCFSWKDYVFRKDYILKKGYPLKKGLLFNDEGTSCDIIIDFTDDWNEKSGGSIGYAENFSREFENYFEIKPCKNTIIIVEKNDNFHRYVQYVNHLSNGKNRYVVLGNLS